MPEFDDFLANYYVPDDEFVICRKVMKRAREEKLSFLSTLYERPGTPDSNLFLGRIAIDIFGYDEIQLIRTHDARFTAKVAIRALSDMRITNERLPAHKRFTHDEFLTDVRIGDVDVYTALDGVEYIGAEIDDDGVTFAERELLKQRFANLGGKEADLATRQPILYLLEVGENGNPSDDLLDHIQDQLSGETLDFYEVMVRLP